MTRFWGGSSRRFILNLPLTQWNNTRHFVLVFWYTYCFFDTGAKLWTLIWDRFLPFKQKQFINIEWVLYYMISWKVFIKITYFSFSLFIILLFSFSDYVTHMYHWAFTDTAMLFFINASGVHLNWFIYKHFSNCGSSNK